MSSNKPVYIISDSPEKDIAFFGFNEYAKTIAELIANRNNKTPLVIGIYGPWGSGKTTLMETVISTLDGLEKQEKGPYRKCKVVRFQAWKYKDEDEILAALVEEIFRKMDDEGFFKACKGKLEKIFTGVSLSKAFGYFVKKYTGIDITDVSQSSGYKDKLGFFDTFQDCFDRVLWTYLSWWPQLSSNQKPDDTNAVLVTFIDDLDRCPFDRILRVLETVKLFMDREGCVFVIGAANEIIEKALRVQYDDEASKFMDKIVQVTFNLPQIPEEDFPSFVQKNSPKVLDEIKPHLPVVLRVMQNNPRRLKRFLNNLSLLKGLLQNKGISISFKNLLYWNIIDYVYPRLREELKETPENLFTLQKYIGSPDLQQQRSEEGDIPQDFLDTVPQSLQGYIQNHNLVKIVKEIDIEAEELRKLITFSGIVESVEEEKEKERKSPESSIDREPMVKVLAGPFLYGEKKEPKKINKDFEIDVYPVTNGVYAGFIKAGGYTSNDLLEQCWTEEGRQWREREKITAPQFWDDEKWNQADFPVVGVSFYEAEAYAKWRDKQLPTEEEWERAARGTDGREYPWQGKFDKTKCNTSESGIDKTTRIARYLRGVSPALCYDMAGNVWEWTECIDDTRGNDKVLRGGSWFHDHYFALCTCRNTFIPTFRSKYVGFRCVKIKSDS